VPLTPAHPVAVLPLRRLGLPLSALVTGAVAPDLPVYLPVGVTYATTHSIRGIAVDAVIGVVLLGLWSAVVRDPFVDLTGLRHRAPARARLGRRAWLLSPVAAAIGAATHVLWDSATHDWGFVVAELAVLRDEVGPLPVHRWFQHGSTVVGSAAVAAYCVHRWRDQPFRPRAAAVRRTRLWLAPAPVAALVTVVVARDPEAGVGAGLLATLLVALAWRARAGAQSGSG
jgi:hypothetical protein